MIKIRLPENAKMHCEKYLNSIGTDNSIRHTISFLCSSFLDKPSYIKEEDDELAFSFLMRHIIISMTLWKVLWPKPDSLPLKILANMTVIDISSAYILNRGLYENMLMSQYLLSKVVSIEEKELRFLVWDRMAYLDRLKFMRYLDTDESKMSGFIKTFETKTQELESNDFFLSSMNDEQRKNVLKGKKRNLLPFDKMALEMGISENYHRSLYKFLNSYAHPNSLGFDHLLSGDQDFMLDQAKPQYEQITSLLLNSLPKVIIENEIFGDDYMCGIIYNWIGFINHFDEFNQSK